MKTLIASLSILTCLSLFPQRGLPILVEQDTTITFNKRVWIQSEKSEIEQRYRESKLEEKLEVTKDHIKMRRDTLKKKVVLLLENINTLKAERDSILDVYERSTSEKRKELDDILLVRDERIYRLQNMYEVYLKKYYIYKRWAIRIACLSVVELVVILVLL